MNLQSNEPSAELKRGILLSGLSLTILPLGSFFGMLGMCSGPNSAGGATGQRKEKRCSAEGKDEDAEFAERPLRYRGGA
jgi:hypothetical protein